MIVKRATKQDLPAIRHLMQIYGKMTVDATLFNNRDIALQARLQSGELVGFIWCGLMAKNSIGYVDKFSVDPNFSKQKIGHKLCLELQKELDRRGVHSVFAVIKQDAYHEKSAMNCLKLAMGAHEVPYTYVNVNIKHSVKEVEMLGENYGR